MDNPNSQLPAPDDEIDLFELVENLWNQKLLIAACTAVSVAFGGIYTLIAPEKWTAEARLSLPKATAIDSLNPPELAVFQQQIRIDESEENRSIRQLNTIAPEVSPEQIMDDFLGELSSVQTLLAFEATVEEPLFQFESTPTEEDRIEAANGFLEANLTVTPPARETTHHVVELTLDEPVGAARVLSDYLAFVNNKVISDRARNLELGIRRAIQTNTFEIQRAERAYVRRLEEDLAVLQEALDIARVAGIQDNQSGLFVGRDDNRLTEASGLYLRGEKLLSAEIQALQARIQASSMIPEVRDLQAENELLNGIQIETSDAFAYTLEKPATPPTGRDAPKTQLILALAVVLGGMVGVLTALIRTAIRNRQARAVA
jgi:chain length determinant protein (polysaccharide antigen chain regulator)